MRLAWAIEATWRSAPVATCPIAAATSSTARPVSFEVRAIWPVEVVTTPEAALISPTSWRRFFIISTRALPSAS
jgi:hypothetical protein